MDFRIVIALWAASLAPLVGVVAITRDLDRGLLWSIRFGIFLLYLTIFVVTVDTFFPFIVGKALATRGLIEVVFGMWVMLAVRRTEFRPRASWLVFAFAAFLLGNLIAAFAGVSFTRSLWSNYERMQGVFDLAHWFALVVVLISVIRGPQQWRVVFNVVVGVGLVAAFLGIAQRYDIRVFSFLDRTARLTSTLGNATYVGAHMAIVTLLALGLLADSIHRRLFQSEAETGSGNDKGRPRREVRPRREHSRSEIGLASDPFTGWLRGLAAAPDRKVLWPVIYATTWALFLPSIASGASPQAAFLGALAVSLVVFLLWLAGGAIPSRPGSSSFPRPIRYSIRLISLAGPEGPLLGFTALVAIWVLLESGSRGGGFALAAGLVAAGVGYAVWGASRRLRVVSGAVAGLVTVAGVLLVLAGNVGVVRTLADTNPLTKRAAASGTQLLDRGRRVAARTAVQGFVERPLVGWGPENFMVPFRRFQRSSDFVTPHENLDQAHNRPLEVLVTTGIVGLVPYVGIWVVVLVLATVRIRTLASEERVLAIFVFGTIVAYLGQSMFLFDTAPTFLLFITIASWAGGGQRSIDREDEALDRAIENSAAVIRQPKRRRRGGAVRSDTFGAEAAGRARVFARWAWIRRTLAIYGTPILVVVLLDAALITIHLPTHRAAYLIIRPAQIDQVSRNVSIFSPLATMPRTQLAEVVASRMSSFSPNERAFIMAAVGEQLEKAIAAEPESVLVRLAASRFFAAASPYRAGYVERARQETDKALQLGPHMHETHIRAVEQAFLEKDLEAARAAVAVWKSEHPLMDAAALDQFDARVSALAAELAKPAGG